MKRRSFVSVSDKRGLEGFARGLAELDFEIVSTAGTSRPIRGTTLAPGRGGLDGAFPGLASGIS